MSNSKMFDFSGGGSRSKMFDMGGWFEGPDAPQINIPAPTEEEKELIRTQTEWLNSQIQATTVATEQQTAYFDKMTADQTLSDLEEREFNKEFASQVISLTGNEEILNQLLPEGVFDPVHKAYLDPKLTTPEMQEMGKALSEWDWEKGEPLADTSQLYDQGVAPVEEGYQGSFDIAARKEGELLRAEMAAKGMTLEDTVGSRAATELNTAQTETLMRTIGGMQESQVLAKSDMESAKQSMATAGYQLTSNLAADAASRATTAAGSLQDYYVGNRRMTASAALQNAMMQQASQQTQYQNTMGVGGSFMGAGMKMMAS